MKTKLTMLCMALALNCGTAKANTPKDAAGSAKPAAAAIKQCYLFNPPGYDRQWTIPCEPSPPPTPTKMCRISNTSGWDAALFTAPCEPVANAAPMKMCRISNTSGWDAALFTEPCENQGPRNQSSTK